MSPPPVFRHRSGSAMDGQHGNGEVLGHHGCPEHEPAHIRLGNERPAEWTVDDVSADGDSARWTHHVWHRDPPRHFAQGE